MDSIDGADLRAWWPAATASRRRSLTGYHLDDSENEWLIEEVTEHGLNLVLLGPDGYTPTSRRRKLPASAIDDSTVVWNDSAGSQLSKEIAAEKPPHQIKADEAYRFLLQRGWPAGNPLGMAAIDVASILKQLDGVGVHPGKDDINRFSSIVEKTKETANFGAKCLRQFIDRGQFANTSLAGHCRIQLSSLFRMAGRYQDALEATSILVSRRTGGLSQSEVAAMCITRAAALMDKFEMTRTSDNATSCLVEAREMLKWSYAIHGSDSEYQKAAFGRLLSLEKSREAPQA